MEGLGLVALLQFINTFGIKFSKGQDINEVHNTTIAIFGGSGFVGRHLVKHLVEKGATLRIGVRNSRSAQYLLPMGYSGQITITPLNICDFKSVHDFVKDTDCVVNLVGILSEKGKQTFFNTYVQGASHVAKAASEVQVKSLIHFSCLGANAEAACSYAQAKGIGEQRVLDAFPSATIIRPSLVFGPEDFFFNHLAQVASRMPILFIPQSDKILYQPVFVRDVAEAVTKIIEKSINQEIYELAGPQVYNLFDLVRLTLNTIERKRVLIHLPRLIQSILGRLTQHPPYTTNMVPSYKEKTLQDLGIAAAHLEIILPTYLERFKPKP